MPSEATFTLDDLTYSTLAELIKILDRPARLFIDVEEWEHLVLYYGGPQPQYDAGGPYLFVLGTRVYPYKAYTKTVIIRTKLRKFDADNDPR